MIPERIIFVSRGITVLENSDSIIKWRMENVQNTANVHEMSKSENANKAKNAEHIFCMKPFSIMPVVTGGSMEFCVWNGHMKIVMQVTHISRSSCVTYVLLKFYFHG